VGECLGVVAGQDGIEEPDVVDGARAVFVGDVAIVLEEDGPGVQVVRPGEDRIAPRVDEAELLLAVDIADDLGGWRRRG